MKRGCNVDGLIGYGMESAELKFDEGAPRVSNPNVSQAATSVDRASGSPRLAMRFTVTADVIYRRTSDGKLVAFPYTKDTTFWMVPNSDKSKPWLIDGYEGAPSGGEVGASAEHLAPPPGRRPPILTGGGLLCRQPHLRSKNLSVSPEVIMPPSPAPDMKASSIAAAGCANRCSCGPAPPGSTFAMHLQRQLSNLRVQAVV